MGCRCWGFGCWGGGLGIAVDSDVCPWGNEQPVALCSGILVISGISVKAFLALAIAICIPWASFLLSCFSASSDTRCTAKACCIEAWGAILLWPVPRALPI